MTIYLQALLGEFPTVIPDEMVDYVTTERVKRSVKPTEEVGAA